MYRQNVPKSMNQLLKIYNLFEMRSSMFKTQLNTEMPFYNFIRITVLEFPLTGQNFSVNSLLYHPIHVGYEDGNFSCGL